MTWGAVAVGGATVVGAGLAYKSSQDAARGADKASRRSLSFEREKLDAWNETYGGIQDNLQQYYSQLTPEFYETQGLEAFRKEQEVAQERIKTSLAQRGIEDSGVALALEHQTEQEGAETRATIRAEAPRRAAEEQRNFLQIGLGQNPGQSYSQALSTRASEARRSATLSEQQAGLAVGQAISSVGKATADYLNRPSSTGVTSTGVAINPKDYSGYA